jgi:hypothetical protein
MYEQEHTCPFFDKSDSMSTLYDDNVPSRATLFRLCRSIAHTVLQLGTLRPDYEVYCTLCAYREHTVAPIILLNMMSCHVLCCSVIWYTV